METASCTQFCSNEKRTKPKKILKLTKSLHFIDHIKKYWILEYLWERKTKNFRSIFRYSGAMQLYTHTVNSWLTIGRDPPWHFGSLVLGRSQRRVVQGSEQDWSCILLTHSELHWTLNWILGCSADRHQSSVNVELCPPQHLRLRQPTSWRVSCQRSCHQLWEGYEERDWLPPTVSLKNKKK